MTKKDKLYEILCMLTTAVLMGFVILCCSSCRSTKIVTEYQCDTIVSQRTDTLIWERSVSKVDTVLETHTYYITLNPDSTVKSTKEVHETYKSKVREDSTAHYKALYDALKVKKQDVKVVEKELTTWQKIKQETYEYLLMLIFLSWLVLFIMYNVKKKGIS